MDTGDASKQPLGQMRHFGSNSRNLLSLQSFIFWACCEHRLIFLLMVGMRSILTIFIKGLVNEWFTRLLRSLVETNKNVHYRAFKQ